MGALFLILGVAFVLSLLFLAVSLVHSYVRQKGPRVIICPETGTSEAVEVDALRAARSGLAGDMRLQLASCSRWPERSDCGQDCLSQIEAAPDGCLVRSRLARWYEGSDCSLCGRAIGEIQWFDHRPGLLGPHREIRQWTDLVPRDLPEILATHQPLCWDCQVAETFRQRFPDLVVDDPLRPVTRVDDRRSGTAA